MSPLIADENQPQQLVAHWLLDFISRHVYIFFRSITSPIRRSSTETPAAFELSVRKKVANDNREMKN